MIGHNQGGSAGDRLRSLIARIERREEEKRGIAADIKEIYADAALSCGQTNPAAQDAAGNLQASARHASGYAARAGLARRGAITDNME